MQVDPHAWLFTIPLTIALAQIAWSPPEHALKRMWRHIVRLETSTWEHLGWSYKSVSPRARRAVFAALLVGLATASLASLAAFIRSTPMS